MILKILEERREGREEVIRETDGELVMDVVRIEGWMS